MISFMPLPFTIDKVRKDFHNQVLRIALKPPIKYKRLNIIIFILHTSKKNLRVKISITLIYYIYIYNIYIHIHMHTLYAHYFERQIPLQNSNKFTDKKITLI